MERAVTTLTLEPAAETAVPVEEPVSISLWEYLTPFSSTVAVNKSPLTNLIDWVSLTSTLFLNWIALFSLSEEIV